MRLHRRDLLAGLFAASLPLPPVRAQDAAFDLRGALDATGLGLSPGSPDDQSTILQHALSEAGAVGRPLFLPPGRYEASSLEAPSFTHLIGVPGQSRLVMRGGQSLLLARGPGRIRVDGLVFEGGRPGSGPESSAFLIFDGRDDAVVEDCEIVGGAGAGVQMRSCAGRVERTRVSGARTVGIHASQSRAVAILDNVVEDCGDTGILVSRDSPGADDTIVRGNRVTGTRTLSGGTGQFGNGINVAQADGVIVAGNRIHDSALSAIRCFSSRTLQIGGNICTQSGETALYVEFAHEGAVVSGNIVDGAAMGITFANADYGGRLSVCSGNVVRNIRGGRTWVDADRNLGTGIGADWDVAITGNVVENALQGMVLGWGDYLRDVSATGNVIRGCGIGIGITVVENTGPAVVTDNLITGSRRAAIVGMRWSDIVTGDLAVEGADAFPALTIARNRTG